MNSSRRLLPTLRASRRAPSAPRPLLRPSQCLHTTAARRATMLPLTAFGPPPKPSPPPPTIAELRKRQADSKSSAISHRFWSEVLVRDFDEHHLSIHLDQRSALKTPSQNPLLIPKSKKILAYAIAAEWSALKTSRDSQKTHLMPLTQLASRAVDMVVAEREGSRKLREEITENLLRYLDTDTILCWEPTSVHAPRKGTKSLRETQIETSNSLTSWLRARIWPGVEIAPMDGDQGFSGKGQSPATKNFVRDWMLSLPAFKLVGFERVVLASKSFLVGARLLGEWDVAGDQRWGIREAAEAATLEVRFQTGTWGEVEDTHDVDKEDLVRQIGAGWLMMLGDETLESSNPSLQ